VDHVQEQHVVICDLCSKTNSCLQKEIDGREYDLCSECWEALAQKLKGKGRKVPETVFLPSRPAKERKEEEPHPLRGEPPTIQGAGHVS